MPKPEDYMHIMVWGKMLGSHMNYILREQERAAEDNAPLDAIYYNHPRWHRFAEVTNDETIHHFAAQGLHQDKPDEPTAA